MNVQTIKNVSDCVPLYLPHSLYLKPSAKFNVSVQLPVAITGKTISNWDVMENLRKMISPDNKFAVLKVSEDVLAHINVTIILVDVAVFELGDEKHTGSYTIRCRARRTCQS